MKAKIVILAVAMGSVLPCGAADSTNAVASAEVKVQKATVHLAKPLAETQEKNSAKVDRVGNTSSRPWTQVVGFQQGQFAADAERYHEPQFTLAWIGNEPRPWTLDR